MSLSICIFFQAYFLFTSSTHKSTSTQIAKKLPIVNAHKPNPKPQFIINISICETIMSHGIVSIAIILFYIVSASTILLVNTLYYELYIHFLRALENTVHLTHHVGGAEETIWQIFIYVFFFLVQILKIYSKV